MIILDIFGKLQQMGIELIDFSQSSIWVWL